MDYEAPISRTTELVADRAADSPAEWSRPPFVNDIWLKNFLSFGPDSSNVPLGRFNVLIGGNGSGKSNFLQAFRVLKSVHTNIDEPFGPGEFSKWVWSNGAERNMHDQPKRIRNAPKARVGQARSLSMDLQLNYIAADSPRDHCWNYSMEIGQGKSQYAELRNESLSQWEAAPLNTEGSKFEPAERCAHGFPGVRSSSRYPKNKRGKQVPILEEEQASLKDLFGDIQVYGPAGDRQFMLPSKSHGAQHKNRTRLNEDFSNLAAVLEQIDQQPERRDELCHHLSHCFFSGGYKVVKQRDAVELFIQERGEYISASHTSHGAVRYLALLVILCDPDPPPLICIEQPEIGMHMDSIPRLADLMVEASRRTQLIVTTYSPTLLDQMSDMPEVVLVVEQNHDQTYLERLNPEEIDERMRHSRRRSLAWLWDAGHLGGYW